MRQRQFRELSGLRTKTQDVDIMADRPGLSEIEITPEMVEAGAQALGAPWVLDDPYSEIVVTIYRAMASLAPPAGAPSER